MNRILVLVLAVPGLALVRAQETVPLQLNVPYRCPNGITYTILKCAGSGYHEICTWREDQNGHLVTEANSQRVYMGGRFASCKVDSAPPSPPPQAATSQPASSPYLTEMPSVDKVKSTIQGTTPDDTLARQVAVLTYLQQIVERMEPPNRRYGVTTPDEQRIMSAYSLAAYQMSQAYAKAHTPEQANEFERLHGRYEMNGTFFNEWFSALFTPEFRAAYKDAVAGRFAKYSAHVAQEQQQYEQATARQKAAAAQQANQNAGNAALQACLESGRSQAQCLGDNLHKEFMQMEGPLFGVNRRPTGLRMGGSYTTGRFTIAFDAWMATLACGGGSLKLPYAVRLAGNRLTIDVQRPAKPMDFMMRPDGNLAGPGPFDMPVLVQAANSGGRAPTYQTETHTTTQQTQIPAADVPNHAIGEVQQNGMEYSVTQQTTTTTSEPAWPAPQYTAPGAIKNVRCDAALMRPTSTYSASEALTQLMGGQPSKLPQLPPGLRLSGTYAAPGGVRIEFRDDSATLQCGEAHVAEAYAVQDSGGRITVRVQNGSQPLMLALQPNGALTGSGSVQVNGRVIAGRRGNEILYAPRTASCNIGTMSLVEARQ